MSNRRGRGEGSIYQRSDGRWIAAVSIGYVAGKLKRKVVYGSTRAEVVGKADRIRAELKQGIVTDDRQTVGAFLADWLDARREHIAPMTWRSYDLHRRIHLATIAGTRLADLQAADIRRVQTTQRDAGLSPRTRDITLIVIRSALKQAMREGLVTRNVATFVESPTVKAPHIEAMTQEQAGAVLAAVSGTWLAPIVLTALGTGLRSGEVLGLRWSSVDLEAGQLHVTHALQRTLRPSAKPRPVEYQLKAPKTDASKRSLALPRIVAEALREHRRTQLAARLQGMPNDLDLVFTAANGRPLGGSTVTHAFQRMLATAGLPRMRFHDLRHGAATLMLAEGTPELVIQNMLGHTTAAMTKRYAHVVPALRQDAADRMDRALGGSR